MMIVAWCINNSLSQRVLLWYVPLMVPTERKRMIALFIPTYILLWTNRIMHPGVAQFHVATI